MSSITEREKEIGAKEKGTKLSPDVRAKLASAQAAVDAAYFQGEQNIPVITPARQARLKALFKVSETDDSSTSADQKRALIDVYAKPENADLRGGVLFSEVNLDEELLRDLAGMNPGANTILTLLCVIDLVHAMIPREEPSKGEKVNGFSTGLKLHGVDEASLRNIKESATIALLGRAQKSSEAYAIFETALQIIESPELLRLIQAVLIDLYHQDADFDVGEKNINTLLDRFLELSSMAQSAYYEELASPPFYEVNDSRRESREDARRNGRIADKFLPVFTTMLEQFVGAYAPTAPIAPHDKWGKLFDLRSKLDRYSRDHRAMRFEYHQTVKRMIAKLEERLDVQRGTSRIVG